MEPTYNQYGAHTFPRTLENFVLASYVIYYVSIMPFILLLPLILHFNPLAIKTLIRSKLHFHLLKKIVQKVKPYLPSSLWISNSICMPLPLIWVVIVSIVRKIEACFNWWKILTISQKNLIAELPLNSENNCALFP